MFKKSAAFIRSKAARAVAGVGALVAAGTQQAYAALDTAAVQTGLTAATSKHCCYKAWHATRKHQRAVILRVNGATAEGPNLALLASDLQQYHWRVDHVRRLRLEFRRKSSNPIAVVSYFEGVEHGHLAF